MPGPSNIISKGVAITPPSVVPNRPKASLNKEGFDTVIKQKGYDVFIDRTISCPCSRNENGHALPGCRNCGGAGWVVYNRIETQAIIHSINRDTKFKEWSEELIGTASFTTYHEVNVNYMDKVTLRNGEVVFNQLLSLVEFTDDNTWRSGLLYPPLSLQAAFLFQDKNSPLRLLELGVDYSIEFGQVFRLLNEDLITGIQNPQVSIRYTHRPEFYVIDLQRSMMNSLSRDPKTKIEGNLDYPVHAILRVAHYSVNVDSFDGSYIFDNSFTDLAAGIKKLCVNNVIIEVPILTQEQIDLLTPYAGQIVYNDDENFYQLWDGINWIQTGLGK
jgi:hypothetical protein